MAVRRLDDEATPLDIAHRIVEVAADRQAVDVVLVDISKQSSFADYFVICNGTSERQVKAIVDTVVDTLEKDGVDALHVEGSATSGWVLIDYGPVIAHVFAPEERQYYKLERLWGESPVVVRVQ